jgi:hypothetical protein
LSVFLKKYDAGGALDSLRRDDFSRFAEIYNGSDYRKNEYDTKLKEFSERFEKLD